MRKIIIALAAVILGGAAATIIVPFIWFCQFTMDWIAHDDVIALGRFERSVRNGGTPLDAFGLGAFLGLFVFTISLFSGHFDSKKRG